MKWLLLLSPGSKYVRFFFDLVSAQTSNWQTAQVRVGEVEPWSKLGDGCIWNIQLWTAIVEAAMYLPDADKILIRSHLITDLLLRFIGYSGWSAVDLRVSKHLFKTRFPHLPLNIMEWTTLTAPKCTIWKIHSLSMGGAHSWVEASILAPLLPLMSLNNSRLCSTHSHRSAP